MNLIRLMETAMNAPDSLFPPAPGNSPEAARFAELLAQPKWRAACVGPGAGPVARQAATAALLAAKAVVLDADALTAFAQGGVHAMHDATEGGVLGGAWEMSDACGLPLRLDLDAIAVPDDILALGKALDFNIWQAISEGTLLAAVAPDAVEDVLKAWERKGIPGFVLGHFAAGLPASVVRVGGQDQPLDEPLEDPFWKLFFAAL